MSRKLDQLIKKLQEIEGDPHPDTFDKIFESYQENPQPRFKGKLIWIVPIVLLAVLLFQIPSFVNNKEINEKSQIVDHAIDQGDVNYTPENGKELKSNTEQQERILETNNSTNLQKTTSASLTSKPTFQEFPEPNTNVKSTYSATSKSDNADNEVQIDFTTNNTLTVPGILTNNDYTAPTNQVFKIATVGNAQETDLSHNDPHTTNNELIDREVIQAQSPIDFLPTSYLVNNTIPTLLMTEPFTRIKEKVAISKKLSIDFYASGGQQHFCSLSKASQQRFGISISYPIYKRLGASLGASQTNTNYGFAFDQRLQDKFGHTDKYPALFSLAESTENISNKLTYRAINFGLYIPIYTKGAKNLLFDLSQELIFSQQQEFIYDLDSDTQEIQSFKENAKIWHQLQPSLIYKHGIIKHLDLSIRMSYNYSLQFIGVEHEKYSGISFGGGLSLSI